MISPELLRRYPFFGTLSEEQLRQIAMIAEEQTYEAGQNSPQRKSPCKRSILADQRFSGFDLHRR